MSTTVVLITGANRGLGRGLLERYLQQPNHTVIAANRNPSHSTSLDLAHLPKAQNTNLIVVKLDATVWKDALEAVEMLKTQGIDRLDVVIANAGVSYIWPTVAEVKEEDIEAHMRPNVYGVVALFQATRKLLKQSKKQHPVFAVVGSAAGSLSKPFPFPNAAYGPSKGAAAWYSLKIDMEEPWLNSLTLDPGWVHTDMGDAGAVGYNVDDATQAKLMIGLKQSCDGMFKVLGETTKAKHGGKLVLWKGGVEQW